MSSGKKTHSRGLRYRLIDEGYIVTETGTCTDTEIIIPKTHRGKPVVGIDECVFSYCCGLTSITIPSTITSIGDYAFVYCTSLMSITIPESVTSIGYEAFYGCRSLKKVSRYKATNSGMTCRGYHFSIGCWHEEEEARLCECGFHFCENAFDLFNYYFGKIGDEVRFFDIEAENVSDEINDDSKRVCKKIKLVREIKSYAELLN